MILPDDVRANGHLPLPTVSLGVELFSEMAYNPPLLLKASKLT